MTLTGIGPHLDDDLDIFDASLTSVTFLVMSLTIPSGLGGGSAASGCENISSGVEVDSGGVYVDLGGAGGDSGGGGGTSSKSSSGGGGGGGVLI